MLINITYSVLGNGKTCSSVTHFTGCKRPIFPDTIPITPLLMMMQKEELLHTDANQHTFQVC